MLPSLFVPTTGHVQERHEVDTDPRLQLPTIWLGKGLKVRQCGIKERVPAQGVRDLGPG